MLEDSDGISKQFELYANISEFIFNFEENKKKKKDNKPAKGVDQFIGEDL
jgi:transposase-like protein